MDILIESTSAFEKDVARLSESDQEIAIQKINDCATLFPIQKDNVYRKLHRLTLPIGLNGYESSLYMLKISEQLRMILAVDEDPIFGQAIFTLFRIVNPDDFYQAHKGVAESLYQELRHQDRETVQVS
jgi:hypothetical protein